MEYLRTKYLGVALLLILLVAAGFRLYGINNVSPPGLEHDEVAHWLINRDILAGNHSIYFADAYGHEAGYHYLQAGFALLLGDNALALRLPSAFAGLLLVAVNFALARQLFDRRTALLSAALLAVLLWPVFYSRLALRAISLPLLTGLSAYFWWRAWKTDRRRTAPGDKASCQPVNSRTPLYLYGLAGLLAGLSLYTYMAARAAPIFFALYIGYLFLFHRCALKRRWRGIALFGLLYIIVAAPLVIYLLANPGAEARISEVNAPLSALLNGELQPVFENTLRFIEMFGFRGDPLWRQNIAFLPVFEPIIAAFFYIGLLLSLWRWAEPRYLFLILWLFTSAIPSIVTIDAPSSIRIVNALPVVTIFPVIGLQVMHIFRRLSTDGNRLSPEIGPKLLFIAVLALLIFNAGRTAWALFQRWPQNTEVQFVWQKALTDAAAYLDTAPGAGPAAVGGWTPQTLDPPTMDLSLRREDLSLRYFDPTQSLIVPAVTDGGPSRIVHPTLLPLDPSIAALMAEWRALTEEHDSFTLYEIDASPPLSPEFPQEVAFGKELILLGYDTLSSCRLDLDSDCDMMSFWRIEEPANGRRRFFLHLVDEEDEIVFQEDALGAPAAYWQPGDILVQRHRIALPGVAGRFGIRLGVYDPDTGQRLLTADGAEFLLLDVGEAGDQGLVE
jgi:4-amino-4-deoxy-L-arabinose transferase-like glycosyltransferase